MNDPTRFAGRWATIGWVENDEIDQVEVCSYDSEQNLYEVRIIETEERINVEFAILKFHTPYDFLTSFPDAYTYKGGHELPSVPAESIMDFSSDETTIVKPGDALYIYYSCRIVGNKDNKLKIGTLIEVSLLGDDEIVEFENICFERGKSQAAVICLGGTVVFRNCTFRQTQFGVGVESTDAPVHVVLESCTFSDHKECAVLLDSGHVTLVNCHISNSGVALVVGHATNASLHAYHCTLTSCVGGVVLPVLSGRGQLFNCTIANMTDFAVLATNSSELHLSKCIIDQCTGDGVVVEGGEGTWASLEACTIRNCRVGVRAGNGRVYVELSDTIVKSCVFGMYVAADTTGCVDVEKCTLSTSFATYDTSFVNLSGDKCEVTNEGELCAPNTQLARLQQSETLMSESGIKYGYPVSAMCKRVLQQAGLMDIVCAKCNAVAPVGTVYKKCAHCREARYCSKQCQIAHRPQHNVECTVLRLRSTLLSTCGYVACACCGEVEVYMTNQPHSACGWCLKVFYCSKQCQKLSWSGHKDKCTPHK